jgi:mono/diheme cytochrome c family protein
VTLRRCPVLGCLLVLAACAKGGHATPAGVVAAADHDAGTPVFGVGRGATPQEIAAWTDEVLPDGTGLPEGRGTAAQGAAVYSTKCAGCHGLHGEGATALPLVGRAAAVPGWRIGRPARDKPRPTWVDFYPFATTLFDYTARAMPWNAPGSLSDDEKYAVIAWLLAQNGLFRSDAVLDRDSLLHVEMPARSRFDLDGIEGLPTR